MSFFARWNEFAPDSAADAPGEPFAGFAADARELTLDDTAQHLDGPSGCQNLCALELAK